MASSSHAPLLGRLHRRRATLEDASILAADPDADADDATLLLDEKEKALNVDVDVDVEDDGEADGWNDADTGLAKAKAVRAETRRHRRRWIVVGLVAGESLLSRNVYPSSEPRCCTVSAFLALAALVRLFLRPPSSGGDGSVVKLS
jgi:hypothetical protein